MSDKLVQLAGYLLGAGYVKAEGCRKSDNLLTLLIPKIIQTVVTIIIVLYGLKITMGYALNDISDIKLLESKNIQEHTDFKVADAEMRRDISNQYREIINRLDAIQPNYMRRK